MTYNENVVIMIPDRRCGMDKRERKRAGSKRAVPSGSTRRRRPDRNARRPANTMYESGPRKKSSRARRRRRNTIIRWTIFIVLIVVAAAAGGFLIWQRYG